MSPRSPSSPLEVFCDEILGLVEAKPDIQLAKIVAHLSDAFWSEDI